MESCGAEVEQKAEETARHVFGTQRVCLQNALAPVAPKLESLAIPPRLCVFLFFLYIFFSNFFVLAIDFEPSDDLNDEKTSQ